MPTQDANAQMLKGLQLAIRAATGASISFGIAQLCRLEYPIYALIAAVIVTDLSPSQTRNLGAQRIVATVAGALCGAVLLSVLQPDLWTIGLGILLAMFLCHLSPMRNGAKVAGYIAGLLLITYHEHPWSYALFRLIETLLGISVAWAISFIPKLIRIEAAEKRPPHYAGTAPPNRHP